MPTRPTTIYTVLPMMQLINSSEKRIMVEVGQDFTRRDMAVAYMRKYNGGVGEGYRGYIRWFILKRVEERTPAIVDMTDAELLASWREWRELQSLPMRSDSMGVADDYLNYPGDMEGYSDYYGEIAKEYEQRANYERSIVDDS